MQIRFDLLQEIHSYAARIDIYLHFQSIFIVYCKYPIGKYLTEIDTQRLQINKAERYFHSTLKIGNSRVKKLPKEYSFAYSNHFIFSNSLLKKYLTLQK